MTGLVLGVDPGTATTGYGLACEEQGRLKCVAYGVIQTPAGAAVHVRLQILYSELSAVVAEYQPVSGAVEKLFFHRNAAAALAVGQGRGVALLALADCKVGVGEYTPREVKQAVTGYGAATKSQIQLAVQWMLELQELPRPDDAADALAVAICHIHSARRNALLAA